MKRMQPVKITTGPHAGKVGLFLEFVRNPYKNEETANVRVQTESGWITLNLNKNNFTKM